MKRYLLALALVGCAHAAPRASAPPGPCDYYPLTVGNRWVYAGPAGEKVAVTITGRRDGFYQDDKGGALACDAQGLRDGKRFLLRAPIEKGHAWTSVVSMGSTEHYEIVEVGGPVTVPAGRFAHTVTVVARNPINREATLVNETTYAPGVGIVRLRTLVETKGKRVPQVSAELESFQPASPSAGSSPSVVVH